MALKDCLSMSFLQQGNIRKPNQFFFLFFCSDGISELLVTTLVLSTQIMQVSVTCM